MSFKNPDKLKKKTNIKPPVIDSKTGAKRTDYRDSKKEMKRVAAVKAKPHNSRLKP